MRRFLQELQDFPKKCDWVLLLLCLVTAAFGLVVIMGLQALLIIGGNTKLLPLTGVTLPLVSYGGSSLVSTFLSMGVLLGISSMNAEDEARDIEKIALREEVSL